MVYTMLDKATLLPDLLRRLDKLPQGHALDLRTYKRNRSVLIRRIGADAFDVTEDGFQKERFQVPFSGLKKLLKVLFKREFPRSTKIRLYALGAADGDDLPTGRKVI
ncbi:hypothetical protein LF599_15080 [Pseudodesulfovibrio thermohalotolerans]|uniref:hypothetical protein n=1 Tax=Pseudodesulfovibrio thermohalotolerans TaxID=2880651 RepID=UPI0024435C07|nr:hypothetical protein [Pseudodesulfovibrio thermohalotolerans]WFS61974.1 hypothetical protein LF599_15080 [Pseudodesulfovibrio thermohalotolerans]